MPPSSGPGRVVPPQVWLPTAELCRELGKPASHLLALMDDPIGWGKMLWSRTAEVWGKNLLHNIYFLARGWEQKATGARGVSSPGQVAPSFTCHLGPGRQEDTQGVRRHFSVSAAMGGGRTSNETVSPGRLRRHPGPGAAPTPSEAEVPVPVRRTKPEGGAVGGVSTIAPTAASGRGSEPRGLILGSRHRASWASGPLALHRGVLLRPSPRPGEVPSQLTAIGKPERATCLCRSETPPQPPDLHLLRRFLSRQASPRGRLGSPQAGGVQAPPGRLALAPASVQREGQALRAGSRQTLAQGEPLGAQRWHPGASSAGERLGSGGSRTGVR